MSVKGLRIQLGISQEKLAKRTDLHRTYISDIECGSRNVSLENIDRLARALEVSVSHLFHKSGHRNANHSAVKTNYRIQKKTPRTAPHLGNGQNLAATKLSLW